MPSFNRAVGIITVRGRRRLAEVRLIDETIEARTIHAFSRRLSPWFVRRTDQVMTVQRRKRRWPSPARLFAYPEVEIVFKDGEVLVVESPMAVRLMQEILLCVALD